MNLNRHRQVADAFVEAMGFARDDRVRAVLVIGSSASGEADQFSDIDMMVAVHSMIPRQERLEKLRAIGCHHIMIEITSANNPAMPVTSEAIDKFVFQDTWFDLSYHLPGQIAISFDYVTLLDKEGMTPALRRAARSYSEEELKARVQADLRLLHARIYRYQKYAWRQEWIGIDLSVAQSLMVDVVMVLNGVPVYNRYSSRITPMLESLAVKPAAFVQRLEDLVNLDNRVAWQRKAEMLSELEADLTALCEARWGPLALFDDETPV